MAHCPLTRLANASHPEGITFTDDPEGHRHIRYLRNSLRWGGHWCLVDSTRHILTWLRVNGRIFEKTSRRETLMEGFAILLMIVFVLIASAGPRLPMTPKRKAAVVGGGLMALAVAVTVTAVMYLR